MEFKGTKGGWEKVTIKNDDHNKVYIVGSDINKALICTIDRFGFGLEYTKESENNASLISTSPELLAILMKYHDMATKIQMPTERELNELAVESQLVINKALNN